MASAAIWLDELGIPPREVCLDWAWQIHSQFAKTQLENARPGPDCATALAWQEIEVSNTGELFLPLPLHLYSPKARLQELIVWAGDTNKVDLGTSTTDSIDLEIQLRKLTASCLKNSSTDTNLTQQSNVQLTTWEAEPESFLLSSTHLVASKASSVTKRNSTLSKTFIDMLKQHKLVASLLSAAVLIVGSFFVLNGGAGKGKNPKPTELSRETKPASDDDFSNTVLPDLDADAALATMTELPDLDLGSGEVQPDLSVTLPSISSNAITGLNIKKGALGSSGPEESLNGEALAPAIPVAEESSNDRMSTQMVDSSSVTEQDVMQELEVAKKSAESKALESDLSVPDSMDANGTSEPFVLQTSPMVQVHKLAAKIKIRPQAACLANPSIGG